MNPATTLSSAFLRRLARTPLRRRVLVVPSRSLSTTAPMLKQQRGPPPSDPHSSSALAALLARLQLPSTPALQQAVLTCLTHPSYSADVEGAEGAEESTPENNELLTELGNSLLGLFASEELSTRYPYLPTAILGQATSAYVGPHALMSVARELGLCTSKANPEAKVHANAPVGIPIRWTRQLVTPEDLETPVAEGFRGDAGKDVQRKNQARDRNTWQEGLASVVRAFVGLIYQEQGMHAAREFVHVHFMSRHVDMTKFFNFRNPKHMLSTVVSKALSDAGVLTSTENCRIESRVLASSGAATQAPLFNVGLFLPNGLKLAEGHGSSLSMAEHRAAINGLLSLYLVQDTNRQVLPTSIHAARPVTAKNLARPTDEKAFTPNPMASGKSEALHGLSSRRR